MYRIEDFQNDPMWTESTGEQFWNYNFRKDHDHAVCDSMTGECSIHYDEYDPHESIGSAIMHLITNKKVQTVATLAILDEIFNAGRGRKALKKFILG